MSFGRLMLRAAAIGGLTAAIILPLGRSHPGGSPESSRRAGHRERSVRLPAWFGDATAPEVYIRGVVHGATLPLKIHLGIDVPDPGIWTGLDVETAADGSFEFGPLVAGRYLVQAYGPAHASRVAAFEPRPDLSSVDLYAYPCEVVHARVSAHGDRPLVSAEIEIAGRHVATTGPSGRFELCGLNEEVIAVMHAEGYRTVATSVWSGARRVDHPMTFAAAKAVPLHGTVKRLDGGSVADLGVIASLLNPLGHGGSAPTLMGVTTDVNGHFVFDGLPRGTYGFDVVGAGQAFQVGERFRIDDAPKHIELLAQASPRALDPRVDPAATWVRGRVTLGGQPVADAEVSAHVYSDAASWQDDVTRSLADGTFELQIGSRALDRERTLGLGAEHKVLEISGSTELRIRPGDRAENVEIEVTSDRATGNSAGIK